MDQYDLLPIDKAMDQCIEILSIEEIYNQLEKVKGDIDILIMEADGVIDQAERFEILTQAVAKYQLYEKLYYIYQLRVTEQKRIIIKDFLKNNPVIKKYREAGIIRD
jgi:hypothetical protein